MSAEPGPGPGSARILVVGDNADDLAQIKRVLSDEFENVEATALADRAVSEFERVEPQVLVLAYKDLDRSQQYYLGLLRKSSMAHGHPHRTLLLCGKDDVRSAFDLCKKEYFDDYILYWPQAQDGHRLAMSVWIACRELAAAHAAGPGPAELAEHVKRIEAMDKAIGVQVAEGARHAAAAQESMARARRDAGPGAGPEQLRRALTASQEDMKPVSAWAEKLGAAVAPHMAGLRDLAEHMQLSRPMVLVVDDDAFAAKLIVKALEHQPWDIVFAADASRALTLLKRARPNVILMDVNMPGMDGLELTERLKATPALADIPVLMLTGEARRETLERSRAAGAAGFIVKPFTRDGLVAKLKPFMG